jgi:hypothetical protein
VLEKPFALDASAGERRTGVRGRKDFPLVSARHPDHPLDIEQMFVY